MKVPASRGHVKPRQSKYNANQQHVETLKEKYRHTHDTFHETQITTTKGNTWANTPFLSRRVDCRTLNYNLEKVKLTTWNLEFA